MLSQPRRRNGGLMLLVSRGQGNGAPLVVHHSTSHQRSKGEDHFELPRNPVITDIYKYRIPG